MIEPYLRCTDWLYTSVDGLIWLSSGLKLPTNLEEKACDAIMKIFKEVEIGQPLIVDFRNVIDVSDRAMEKLFNAISDGYREIMFINFDNIIEPIDKVTTQIYKKNYSDFSTNGYRCRVFNPLSFTDQDYLTLVNEFRKKKVTEYVKSSVLPFEKPQFMASTPLQATGMYDASTLLNNHSAFYWICLELADLIRTLLNPKTITFNNKELRLLAVNMKACSFASVVSLLLKIPLVTIDHAGPKHKIYDIDILDDLQNLRSFNYIYVGDFCVGGTEIKIAQTYAQISNSNLSTAVVIGAYFSEGHFSPSFQLFSLVEIKDLNPNAKFSI